MKNAMRPNGFTLVELLVAMFVFSLVLLAVGAFLTGGLRFSEASAATADRLREINDASGYLSDNVRRAAVVEVRDGVSCGSVPATIECLWIVVRSVVGEDPPTPVGVADTFVVYEYHVIPYLNLAADQRSPAATVPAGARAVVEYREGCGSSVEQCLSGEAIAGVQDRSGASGPFLLLDFVTDQAGFELQGDDDDVVVLSFQVANVRRGSQVVTPQEPIVLAVAPRNLDSSLE